MTLEELDLEIEKNSLFTFLSGMESRKYLKNSMVSKLH